MKTVLALAFLAAILLLQACGGPGDSAQLQFCKAYDRICRFDRVYQCNVDGTDYELVKACDAFNQVCHEGLCVAHAPDTGADTTGGKDTEWKELPGPDGRLDSLPSDNGSTDLPQADNLNPDTLPGDTLASDARDATAGDTLPDAPSDDARPDAPSDDAIPDGTSPDIHAGDTVHLDTQAGDSVAVDLQEPDIAPFCGDGALTAPESCDWAILAGPGKCLEDCPGPDGCLWYRLDGSAADCDLRCTEVVLVLPENDDGCCPEGASVLDDNDCQPVCGNGLFEPGELCDFGVPKGNAGACVDSCPSPQGCNTWVVLGDPLECTVLCGKVVIKEAGPQDKCCPVGANANTDPDCTPLCGNGVVEAPEKCDKTINQGAPGACPAACAPSDPCKTVSLAGDPQACSALCQETPVTTIGLDDGCCPEGGNNITDPDCTSFCGNDIVETGEDCDKTIAAGQPGACPASCPSADPCKVGSLLGKADLCSARCDYTTITAAGPLDDCCPAGGNNVTDKDCDPVCGNAVVEAGESCDKALAPGAPGACPASCPTNQGCQDWTLLGEALDCTALCFKATITEVGPNDGCCPSSGNANTDPDCDPVCGNGLKEAGEDCDKAILSGPHSCPTKCTSLDPCIAAVLEGAGGDCSARCVLADITLAGPEEGCCPPGANANTDPDCDPICGNGVKEAGEDCDKTIAAGQPGACPTECQPQSGCQLWTLGGSAANCSAKCTQGAISTVGPADTCCPAGAVRQTDPDCPVVCGDGYVDSPETCDKAVAAGGAGVCPTSCNADLPCTKYHLLGAKASCDARCEEEALLPGPKDGCCVDETTPGTDPDCPGVCGNGVVEVDETCDPGDPATKTCASLTKGLGTIGCGSDCEWETWKCYNNGVFQYEKVPNLVATGTVVDIDWHPSGDYALLVTNAKKLVKYTAATQALEVVATLDSLNRVKFHPDGSFAYIVGYNFVSSAYQPRVWRFFHATGTTEAVTMGSAGMEMREVKFHPKGDRALIVGTIKVGSNYNNYVYRMEDPWTTPKKTYAYGFGQLTGLMWGHASANNYEGAEFAMMIEGWGSLSAHTYLEPLAADNIINANWPVSNGNGGRCEWQPDGDFGIVAATSTRMVYVFNKGAWRDWASAWGSIPNTCYSTSAVNFNFLGTRALVMSGTCLSAASIVEFRVAQGADYSTGTWHTQSIGGWTAAPWNGGSSTVQFAAWRPKTECEQGLVVAGPSSSTYAIVARFYDLNDPDCP